ncbi:hypothetical protein BH23CHL2_BH23CHL2_00320 [soil metagenome]
MSRTVLDNDDAIALEAIAEGGLYVSARYPIGKPPSAYAPSPSI